MSHIQVLSLFTDLWDRMGSIASNPFSLGLFVLVIMALLWGCRWLMRHSTPVQDRLSSLWEKIANFISPQRRIAQLHKVICPYCRRGRAILNPVYVTYLDVPHIEGTCVTCGHFLREKLQ
jgi:hypothetical protein